MGKTTPTCSTYVALPIYSLKPKYLPKNKCFKIKVLFSKTLFFKDCIFLQLILFGEKCRWGQMTTPSYELSKTS